jgi:hypothetical protein
VNLRLGDDPAPLPAAQRGQAEPHLYRSISNTDTLLATFQEGRFSADGGAVGCGYSVSHDGGLTWTRALIPHLTVASGGPYRRATDPVAAIGPDGTMYLNTLGSIDDAFGLAAVLVSRSHDHGATWLPPVVVFEAPNRQVFPDKNWIAVNDYAGTPNAGQLAVTWTSFTSTPAGQSTGHNLMAAISDDRGATWSAPVAITTAPARNQGSQPVFLPDGSLGLVYIEFLAANDITQFNIQYKRSTDGGRSFPAAATTVVGFVPGWDDPEVRDGVFLPSATVARGTGAIFVTYTAVVAGSPRVMVTRSADRGATWSVPVAASDQPAGVSVMNPAVAVTPDGRTVSVVFMDKRNAPAGQNVVDHFVALSFDGAVTWQPNLRLTELSSDLRYGPQTSRGVMIGDYLGVAPSLSPDQPCVAIWCDTRTGDSDPFTVRFTPAAAPDYGAWAVARAVRGSPLHDDDGDGEPNYLEFLHGTDPLRRESGEGVVVRPLSGGTIEIAWTERAHVERLPIHDGVSLTRMAAFASAGFSLSAIVAAAPAEPAGLPRRGGLVWRAVQLEVSPGEAYAVARTLRTGNGPAQAGRLSATINTDARLINLSTRGHAGAGANQLIVGFAIDGRKSVLVRAAGPALSPFGVSGWLADPQLTVTAPALSITFTNTRWQQAPVDAALFVRLGAFPFAAGSLDAAVLLDAAQRNYTAAISGGANAAGVALVEAYDADGAPGHPAGPRFLNLSTRGEVDSGQNALVAGFVLSGTQPRRVLLRGIGPSLAAFGVVGNLADPVLRLFSGDVLAGVSDDWEISRSGGAIAAVAQQVGAFPLASGSLDAALLVTLPPGGYTAVLSSGDGGGGIALVEVYDAD